MTLASLRQRRHGLRAMGELMGRSPSTLRRGLRRNSAADGTCASIALQRACEEPRQAARPPRRLSANGPLWRLVAHMLNLF